MTRFRRLPQIDETQRQQNEVVQYLAQAGLKVSTAFVHPQQRYLHFRVEVGKQAFEAFIDPQQWLATRLPSLAGLAWPKEQDTHLLDLFNQSQQAITWQNHWLKDTRTVGLGLKTVKADSLIRLQSAEGDIFCHTVPSALFPTPSSLAWVDTLPLTINVLLGQQPLAPSLLKKIEVGDVLLLQRYAPLAIYHGHTLFSYSMKQEHIIVEKTHDQRLSAASTPGIHTESLPLQVEFVLDTLTLTVGEANRIAPGQIFSLSPDAEHNVEIRANGVTVARGELVELEHQLGIQIKSQ